MDELREDSPGWDLLLHLPADILVNHVLVPYLSPRDKQALRQTSRLCRSLANAAVGCCVLDAYSSNEHVHQQLPSSFPNLRTLRITCTPPDSAKNSTCDSNSSSGGGTSSGASSDGRSSDNIPHLQEQLPAVLTELPCLSHLVYEGPRDRRQPGLNMTAALQALATAAAAVGVPQTPAAVTPRSAAAAAVSGLQLDASSHAESATAAAAAAAGAASSLRVLELTSGSLPDALMEAVGGLTGLVSLKLNATAAIHMAPVSKLTGLTSVILTVTPPLPSAIWPLSRLTRLSALQLSALSPARGWGTVLARLAPACPVDSLTLSFADNRDEVFGAMSKALMGISYLNLNYSRHLTPAAVPHLAALPNLSALHLQETGLTLGAAELVLLGTGCTGLHTLEAAFDLHAVPIPPWAANRPRSGRALHVDPDSRNAAPAAATAARGRALAAAANGFGAAAPAKLGHVPPQGASSGSSNGSNSSNSYSSGWPRLQRLMLNGVSVSDFDKLINGFSQLTSLVLDNMGPNGNQILLDLTKYLPQPPPLQDITLSAGGPLDMSTGSELGRAWPLLKSVTLANMRMPHPAAVTLLDSLSLHGRLESLVLIKDPWLHAICFTALVARMTQLRQLEIVQCDNIAVRDLATLVAKLPLLTRLVVRECGKVQPSDARALERQRAAAAAAAGAGGVGPTAWAVRQDIVIQL